MRQISHSALLSQSVLVFLCLFLITSLINGELMKIHPKLCSNAIGEEGTCMFVWECIKTEGRHLGTCADGFLFGSCCGHNESSNNLDQNMEPSEPPIELPTNINKEKHKNKWKPPSTVTALTVTSTMSSMSTTTSPKPAITFTTVPPHKNSTNSLAIMSTTPKPKTTTSKPWIIYQGNRPMATSTYRPAIISVLATNRPSIHFPLLSNIPNKNYTHKPLPTPTGSSYWNTNALFAESTSKIPATAPSSTVSPVPDHTTIDLMTSSESTSSPAPQTTPSNNRPSNEVKYQCGVTQLRPKTKVVGGKNSAFGAWPWQVSVRRTHFFGFSSTHRCGGAILNNQWIATAGHCVDDLLLTQIRIRVGEYDFSSSLEPLPHIERGVKKKIVHPKYNFFTYENDLALVQLDEPIEFQTHISPICLPPDNVNLLGKNATVTGWGRLSEGGVLPTVLQEVRVPIVSNDKCKNMFLSAGRHEYIPDIFMCAGHDEGGRDSCQGDSGGPLQVQGDDGRWFLAGIISWGIGCGEPSLPGVCTRISKFKQWIMSYISN